MMPPPSPAVTERVNNPECRVAILSLDQLRVWVPHLLVAVDEVIKCGSCLLQRKMSLFGTKRTCETPRLMSAFGGKAANICSL
jgi:hypothetical protein